MDSYDREVNVIFHESKGHPFYFCSFKPETHELDSVLDRIEGAFGEQYERAIDPGEAVHVGVVRYDSSVEHHIGEEDTTWYELSKFDPDKLGVELDGETYEEETTERVQTDDAR